MDTPDTPGLKVICPNCGQKVLLPTPKPASQNRTVLASEEDLQPSAAPTPTPIQTLAPVSIVPMSTATEPHRSLAPYLIGGGSILAVLLILLVILILTRTPTYTVDGLVKAYHSGMRGQRVRVTGPLYLITPARGNLPPEIILHAPGQRCWVGSEDFMSPAVRPTLDEVITLVGEISELRHLRPFTRHDGIRVETDVDVVILRNAQVER